MHTGGYADLQEGAVEGIDHPAGIKNNNNKTKENPRRQKTKKKAKKEKKKENKKNLAGPQHYPR